MFLSQAHPSASPPLASRARCISATSLALLVHGNAPFPLVPAPSFAHCRAKGASWPCTTPPPPSARFGDSGESVGPRPTPERGRPPSGLPGSAHAKACCVIPTWADIPCPGRSGVGLLIMSAADPRHQPIYCPVFPRLVSEAGEGSARKEGEGITLGESLVPAIGAQGNTHRHTSQSRIWK